MRKAPFVNLNTNALIKELVGEYNAETEALIHGIAENQTRLLKGCQTVADYQIRIEEFISEFKK